MVLREEGDDGFMEEWFVIRLVVGVFKTSRGRDSRLQRKHEYMVIKTKSICSLSLSLFIYIHAYMPKYLTFLSPSISMILFLSLFSSLPQKIPPANTTIYLFIHQL